MYYIDNYRRLPSLPTLFTFKKQARWLRKHQESFKDDSHSKALDHLAQIYGYKNYFSIKPKLLESLFDGLSASMVSEYFRALGDTYAFDRKWRETYYLVSIIIDELILLFPKFETEGFSSSTDFEALQSLFQLDVYAPMLYDSLARLPHNDRSLDFDPHILMEFRVPDYEEPKNIDEKDIAFLSDVATQIGSLSSIAEHYVRISKEKDTKWSGLKELFGDRKFSFPTSNNILRANTREFIAYQEKIRMVKADDVFGYFDGKVWGNDYERFNALQIRIFVGGQRSGKTVALEQTLLRMEEFGEYDKTFGENSNSVHYYLDYNGRLISEINGEKRDFQPKQFFFITDKWLEDYDTVIIDSLETFGALKELFIKKGNELRRGLPSKYLLIATQEIGLVENLMALCGIDTKEAYEKAVMRYGRLEVIDLMLPASVLSYDKKQYINGTADFFETKAKELLSVRAQMLSFGKGDETYIDISNFKALGQALTQSRELPEEERIIKLRVEGAKNKEEAVKKIMATIPEIFRKNRFKKIYIHAVP